MKLISDIKQMQFESSGHVLRRLYRLCHSSNPFRQFGRHRDSFFTVAVLVWAVLVVLPYCLVAASAPPVISQLVSVAHPLSDEFGNVLKGTDPGAGHFGHQVVEGDVVHIYIATDGNVYPPDVNGQPDVRNVLLSSTRIGRGTSAKAANPGMFSTHLTPRPGGGSKIFVRIFNAASVEDASFYMDSQLFTVSWSVDTPFVAEFSEGILALDTADDDNDGLHNSWEKSYGTNPNLADSDGDGLTDQEELIAGTDPIITDSVFVIADVMSIPPNYIRLSWQTELDREYFVQRKLGLDDANDFATVAVVNGNGSVYELIQTESEDGFAVYRIKVSLQSGAE